MNTLPSYPPLFGAELSLRSPVAVRDTPPAASWLDAGADSRFGPLHVGSDTQPRNIDAIEQDFRAALLEPNLR